MKFIIGPFLGIILALLVSSSTLADWPVASRKSYISKYPSSSHPAVDVATAWGTKIIPVWAGRIVYRGWRNNCGGRQVYVKHNNGYYTAYYHMSSYGRAVGAYVKPSNPTTYIGRIGSTGCSTGPHVHVEFWKGYPWRSGSYRVRKVQPILSGYYLPRRYR